MPTAEEILALAKVFVSVSGTEEAALRCFCSAARERVEAMLRDGVQPRFCRESLLCGMAMLAAADYSAADNADAVGEFTAGELKVKRGAAPDALRGQAFLLLTPFCRSRVRFTGAEG